MQRAGGSAPGRVLGDDAWAAAALASLCALPDVHRAGVALAEVGGRRLRFTASDQETPGWCHVDAYDDIPLNTAVRTGTVVTGSLSLLARHYPAFVARQHRAQTPSIAAVPVRHDGETLGGFVVYYGRAQLFRNAQRRDLADRGEELGRGLRNGQLRGVPGAPSLRDEPARGAVAFHDVPPTAVAVSGARQFLAETLSGWPVPRYLADIAVLCLSELVTNALLHSRRGCEVRVELDAGRLTTSVRDCGPARVNDRDGYDDPLRVHGRGLQIVEALTSRWGSQVDDNCTTVWFALDV